MADDSKSGVCLFYQRAGTCKNGDKCPLSHIQEQRGITTRYDDRLWHSAQVVVQVKLNTRKLVVRPKNPSPCNCSIVCCRFSNAAKPRFSPIALASHSALWPMTVSDSDQ